MRSDTVRHQGEPARSSTAPQERCDLPDALIVEDESSVGDLIQQLVEECGCRCRRASSAEEAEKLVAAHEPDIILLDLRLPLKSGKEFLTQYRERGGDAPVIVVSGVDDISVRVDLLSRDADDFIVKPFVIEDLKGHVRAVLRRPRSQRYLWRNDGHLRLDPANGRATYRGHDADLTPIQFGIVWVLAARNEAFVSIEELCQQLFGNKTAETIANCHAHISKLRKRLEQLGPELELRSAVGIGYSLLIGERTN